MNEEKRATMTVEEAARLLGVSRNTGYEAVRRGQIPSVRVGKRYLIPIVAMEKLLKGEAAR
jgi:excisionase family DNA binding protein